MVFARHIHWAPICQHLMVVWTRQRASSLLCHNSMRVTPHHVMSSYWCQLLIGYTHLSLHLFLSKTHGVNPMILSFYRGRNRGSDRIHNIAKPKYLGCKSRTVLSKGFWNKPVFLLDAFSYIWAGKLLTSQIKSPLKSIRRPLKPLATPSLLCFLQCLNGHCSWDPRNITGQAKKFGHTGTPYFPAIE